MAYQIKPAAPASRRIMVAIGGPSASGKTTSALRLAEGIVKITGGKIVLCDTEKKRALQYAKNFKFNHLEIDPPFSPDNYDKAFQFVEANGYGEGDVVIIDSMTHEHDGPGGVLEMHEDFIDQRTNNSTNHKERDKYNLLAWNYAKKGRKRFLYFTLQRTKCHVILCFRAKEKVEQGKDEKGKSVYINSGFQPIGGEEYFYEMDITMILPLGAAGKPDWTEKASRINEYGEGPLKKLLHSTEQISQATGEGLARIVALPEASTMPTPEETPELKIKRLAGAISRAYTSATDGADVESVTHDYKDDIETVKAASQAAYDHIMKVKAEKIAALEAK